MTEAIWVALIGAVATVVAAVITSRSRSREAGAARETQAAPVVRERQDSPHTVLAPPPVEPRATGQVRQPEAREEAERLPPPAESAFPLVQSWEQIEDNLLRLERYLQSANDEERQFAKDLFHRPKCVVVSSRGGRVLAGPSRFVGYVGNTREQFLANEDKDGRDTNWALNRVFGKAPAEDSTLEQQYQAFCRRYQVEKVAQVSRKYWGVE